MATRNLTTIYEKLRRDAIASCNSAEDEFDLEAQDRYLDKDIEMTDMANPSSSNRWKTFADSVTYDVTLVEKNMGKLKQLHTVHLTPSFNDDEKEHQLKEIEAKTREITEQFRGLKDKIHRLCDMLTPNSRDYLIAQNLQSSLATDVRDLSTRFHSQQKVYLKKLESQRSFTHESNSIFSPEEMEHGGEAKEQEQEEQEEVILREQESIVREQEIQSLSRSIADLADIFNDLNTMIVDQGTMLDRIDYNISVVEEHTASAVVELKKANDYSGNEGKCWCYILLLIIILVLIGIIVAGIFI